MIEKFNWKEDEKKIYLYSERKSADLSSTPEHRTEHKEHSRKVKCRERKKKSNKNDIT